jgi:FkbM family methyltransferase
MEMNSTAIVKTALRAPFHAVGLDIVRRKRRLKPGEVEEAGIAAALEQRYSPEHWFVRAGIRTILDVGAHMGEFAQRIRTMIPDAELICFEPLAEPFSKLTARFAGQPRFRAFHCALGDAAAECEMHHNEYGPSSSLLEMTDLHKKSFEFAVKAKPEKVVVRRLSDVAQGLALQEPILLKLDVQGFESKVIAGGEDVVSRARIIIVEVSFQSLYRGGPLFDDLYRMMTARGFSYQGNFEQLLSPKDGRVLQADAIFYNGRARN